MTAGTEGGRSGPFVCNPVLRLQGRYLLGNSGGVSGQTALPLPLIKRWVGPSALHNSALCRLLTTNTYSNSATESIDDKQGFLRCYNNLPAAHLIARHSDANRNH